MGYSGALLVIGAVTFEFLAALSITLVFMWQNLHALLGNYLEFHWTILISSAAALPTIWILRLSDLGGLQFLGFFSSFLIVLTMIIVRVHWGELGPVDVHEFVGPDVPLSVGIFVLS